MRLLLENFHFLRPWWLLLLPLVGWLLYRMVKHGSGDISLWKQVCDAALLDRFLVGAGGREQRWPWWLLGAGLATALIALAGPVWQQMAQPVYRQQQALVIVLDLSRSMLAADNKPDRLTHAKQKLSDLFELRHEGQTALVVYAADAFVIAPLTDDVQVIAQQLPVLKPDMMPAQGSRLDLALQQALQLLKNSGVADGEVLVLTDSADRGKAMAADLHHRGHRVSVLGFGSADGAPIAGSSGFVTDSDGNIVVARTNWSALHQLAEAGGGRFARAALDDTDLQQLTPVLASDHAMNGSKKASGLGDQWREAGSWLMLLLLPLAALAFRRGWVLAVLVMGCVMLPAPVVALEFSNLWRNDDQQGKQLLDQGKAKQAAGKFNDPRWKSAAHYRSGDYANAAQLLEKHDDADSAYNRGNALAKAGKLPQALAAYDQALKKNPQMKDAAFNRDLVKKLQEKQKKQKDKQGKKGSKKKKEGEKGQKGDKNGDQGDQRKQGEAGDNKGKSSPQNGNAAKNRPQQQPDHAADKQQEKGEQQKGQQQQGQKGQKDQQADNNGAVRKPDPKSELESEQKQARQQWLRRIPDDPGGLLRRKFQYQYRQRGDHEDEGQRW
ncbi:MAG: VWA domain-containing protein [Mariprofundales bacterium]